MGTFAPTFSMPTSSRPVGHSVGRKTAGLHCQCSCSPKLAPTAFQVFFIYRSYASLEVRMGEQRGERGPGQRQGRGHKGGAGGFRRVHKGVLEVLRRAKVGRGLWGRQR